MSQFATAPKGNRNLPPPPIFAVTDNESKGNRGTISLGDIFDEFLFNEGGTAKAPQPNFGQRPEAITTNPVNTNNTMNASSSSSSSSSNTDSNINNNKSAVSAAAIKREDPTSSKVGAEEDFEDVDDDSFDGEDEGFEDETMEDRKKRKRVSRGIQRSMTEEQKIERRERNREHAKRSRVRKKFLLESLQHSVHALEEENEKLRAAIREHINDGADKLLSSCTAGGLTVLTTDPNSATKTLDDPDYSLVKALQTAQQNFVISDPSVPDNPIVYASQGFLSLTGYTLEQVLGRNCRFLQGPDTDLRSVDRIRRGIEKGEDTTVCLLNYRSDATTFWNQFFIAALRDGSGNVVNYLGVQCKVSEEYARAFIRTAEFEEGKK